MELGLFCKPNVNLLFKFSHTTEVFFFKYSNKVVKFRFMSLSCHLTKLVITPHYTHFNGKKLGQRYKHNGPIGNQSTPEVKIKISIDQNN